MDEKEIEAFAEELAKIDPTEWRALLPKPEILKKVLDDPISEETQKRLQPPLRPKPFQPREPPRRSNGRQELLRSFDPLLPTQNRRNVTDYQNEIRNVHDVLRFEDEEAKGRRYIRWRFTRRLGEDHTARFMKRIRGNVRTAFYMRHVRAYRLRNRENGDVIIMYKNQGSPWMNNLEEAEEWLKTKETERLEKESTTAPDTNWEPEEEDNNEDFSLDLNVVLDRAPLMGTGPLPNWLRKPCTWPGDGRARYLSRQPLFMALHCCAQRIKTRSKHNSRKRAGKELLQAQDDAEGLSKNLTR